MRTILEVDYSILHGSFSSLPFTSGLSLTTLSNVISIPIQLYSVPENYHKIVLSPLLRVTSSRHSKQNILRSFYENQNSIYKDKYQYEDLSQVNYATSGTETNTEIDDLYTDSINVLLPDYLLSELNNQYSVPFLIRENEKTLHKNSILAKPYAYLSRFPGFLTFSSFSIYSNRPEVLVTEDHFLKLIKSISNLLFCRVCRVK